MPVPAWKVRKASEVPTAVSGFDNVYIDEEAANTISLKNSSGTVIHLATTAEGAPAELASKKLLAERSVVIKAGEVETTAATPFLLNAVGGQVKAAAAKASFGEVIPDFIFWKAADWAITGRTAQVVLAVDLTAAIAPAANITFGLYKVTTLGEVEKQTEITVTETAVATALFTAPAAKTGTSAASSGVALTDKTLYIMGFALSAATAAKSLVTAHARLFVNYT